MFITSAQAIHEWLITSLSIKPARPEISPIRSRTISMNPAAFFWWGRSQMPCKVLSLLCSFLFINHHAAGLVIVQGRGMIKVAGMHPNAID